MLACLVINHYQIVMFQRDRLHSKWMHALDVSPSVCVSCSMTEYFVCVMHIYLLIGVVAIVRPLSLLSLLCSRSAALPRVAMRFFSRDQTMVVFDVMPSVNDPS